MVGVSPRSIVVTHTKEEERDPGSTSTGKYDESIEEQQGLGARVMVRVI